MDSNFLQHDLRGNIYFIFNSKMKCWLVLIRKANILNFECIHRGLEVAFRTEKSLQMSLSFIKIRCVTKNFRHFAHMLLCKSKGSSHIC